jgi:thioredoxin-like negative regulator of GroEL
MRSKAPQRALSVWRQAALALPDRVETWLAVSRLERRLGREQRAVDALLAGRRQLQHRRQRPEAIHLLREARALRPWDPDLVLDLARLLSASGRRAEAEDLLEALAERTEGVTRRRVRGAHWRIAPSLARAWLWLRAA